MTEQLDPKIQVDPVEVVGHAEHLSENAQKALSHSRFPFFMQSMLDTVDLCRDVFVVSGKASNLGQISYCMVYSCLA